MLSDDTSFILPGMTNPFNQALIFQGFAKISGIHIYYLQQSTGRLDKMQTSDIQCINKPPDSVVNSLKFLDNELDNELLNVFNMN